MWLMLLHQQLKLVKKQQLMQLKQPENMLLPVPKKLKKLSMNT
jgi:hypothetical protein